MRFVMYTDKSVAQTMKAINERLHATGTKTRPQMDGWVEKNGRFAIGVSTKVFGRFRHKTTMRGHAQREGGTTVVEGNVPGGLPRNRQFVVLGVVLLVAFVFMTQGQAILAFIAAGAGAALMIPFQGDYDNSEILLTEVQKALKARFAPPKR